MAGRGVDILLGGNAEYLARQEMAAQGFDNDRYLLFEMDAEERAAYEAAYAPIHRGFKEKTDAEHDEVVARGGLYVLGTERHESRRIDNQLRGRSGRQGDPGSSRFYLSLQDEMMRTGYYYKVWQSFCVFLPVRTVGVFGDERTYDHVVAIRIVESTDAMTADWAKLPHEIMQRISSRITNEVRGVGRVVYDVSSKPPATIEWE